VRGERGVGVVVGVGVNKMNKHRAIGLIQGTIDGIGMNGSDSSLEGIVKNLFKEVKDGAK
jgi:hypothetical protein